MHTQTQESQKNQLPEEIVLILKEGNKRFTEGKMEERDLLKQVTITSEGQFPHTVVLGCIDSRATSEQIFDQGIGDIFNTRIAGNVVDEDVLGSLEFSCEIAGAKLILVLGHTKCGAVTSACKDIKLGHITALLNKIKPAVEKVKQETADICSPEAINLTVIENVHNSIKEIRNGSAILRELELQNKIKIIGGLYHVESGVVDFL